MIKVKKLNNNATFEKFGGFNSVGYDLTCTDIYYKEDGRVVLHLGVQVQPPDGYYFEIVPRSSFSKSGFIMTNSVGVIDPDYRGEWMMVIRFLGTWLQEVQIAEKLFLHNRVAQAILRKVQITRGVEFVNELSSTERGSAGFGSTGK